MSLIQTAHDHLLSLRSLVLILCIGSIYFFITLYLLNYQLVFETLTNSSSFLYKVRLLTELSGGAWTALSHLDLFLSILTALLIGCNVHLLFALIKKVREQGKTTVALGGGTLLGFVGTGCSSCGFSVISLFGISGTVGFLPFHGQELHYIAISLLLFSLWYSLYALSKAPLCKRKR